jgi:hypothetical protein
VTAFGMPCFLSWYLNEWMVPMYKGSTWLIELTGKTELCFMRNVLLVSSTFCSEKQECLIFSTHFPHLVVYVNLQICCWLSSNLYWLKVVMLALCISPLYPPGNIPGTHFC